MHLALLAKKDSTGELPLNSPVESFFVAAVKEEFGYYNQYLSIDRIDANSTTKKFACRVWRWVVFNNLCLG